MAKLPFNRIPKIILAILFLSTAIITNVSCGGQKEKALRVVVDHLKVIDPELRDIKLELFHTTPSIPDKAYVSVTGTRGFASGAGKAQEDHLGFLVVKEGEGWKMAQSMPIKYTVDPAVADRYLAGNK